MVEKNFENTEIGLIPEGWEVKLFTDLFIFLSTASYSRSELDNNSFTGYIHYGDIHTKIGNHLNTNKFVSGYISDDKIKSYPHLKQGDLVIADASEDYSGVGKAFEVINIPDIPVISGLHTFLLRDKSKNFVLGFKGYFHLNPIIKKQYDALATGLKVYSLSKSAFDRIYIPIPPLAEQQAIAETLTHTDQWIESLEKLIAKKQMIKQGAMQKLLTPKKEWEMKKLGDIAEIIIGLTYTPNDVKDFGTLVLRSSNIQNGKLAFENNVFVEMELPTRVIVKENDLLVCVRNGSKQLIGKCALIDRRNVGHAFGAFMSIIRCGYNKYIYHYFSSKHIQNQIDENLGATINQLTNSTLNSFEIYFPRLAKEQTYIATILSDMDSEIDSLEQKLSKAKQIKQGMMQELLTGRIRLVNNRGKNNN